MHQHISFLLGAAASYATLLVTSAAFAGPAPGLPDATAWIACMRGPNISLAGDPCMARDLDGDEDVDLHDFALAVHRPVCGNTVVEAGENCDPPDGFTCSESCLFLPQGTIGADDCAIADIISGEGLYPFNNRTATRDGPRHRDCVFAGEDNIDADVWACWTAPCTATVFAQTCGMTMVDTKIAVYEGCTCPVGDANLLACNDDRCDVQTIAPFEAQAGNSYLIRLGVFPGELPGMGALTLTCGLPACGGVGRCDATHVTPGCEDETCCETVCAVDNFCCDTDWDDVCVSEAAGLCTGSFPACALGAGACTEANGSGGCEDTNCCNTVCMQDPFCCLNDWDNTCVDQEAMFCSSSCRSGAGDCFAAAGTGSPGCENPDCCAEVCVRDPFCCRTEWDGPCAEAASAYCR